MFSPRVLGRGGVTASHCTDLKKLKKEQHVELRPYQGRRKVVEVVDIQSNFKNYITMNPFYGHAAHTINKEQRTGEQQQHKRRRLAKHLQNVGIPLSKFDLCLKNSREKQKALNNKLIMNEELHWCIRCHSSWRVFWLCTELPLPKLNWMIIPLGYNALFQDLQSQISQNYMKMQQLPL